MRGQLRATWSTMTTRSRALGLSGRRRLACVAAVMALAVLGGTLVGSPVAGQHSVDIEARIVARKIADGRIEFGLQERAPGGSWSEIVLPTSRFFPTTATVDRWLASSRVAVGLDESIGGYRGHARLVARKIADGRIEFALQQREADTSWGDIQFPTSRFFPATATVDRWLASSVLSLTVTTPTSGSSGGTTVVTTQPPSASAPTTPEPGGPASTALYSDVSVHDTHSCGLHTDGAITCWGDNAIGQAEAPDGQFSAVSAGIHHTCAVRTNGTITCWGSPGIRLNAPDGQFIDVAAGDRHSCGVRTDGTVACWGDNALGQAEAPDGQFSAVTAGIQHSCGLHTDGTIACWASGSRTNPPDGEFSSVSAGDRHTCGVHTDGTVECWGHNNSGQTNASDGEFSAVSGGSQHSCGLRTDGTVKCWGSPWYGQVVAPRTTFSAVSAGGRHSCGVRTDGEIVCWGDNTYGQRDVPQG